MFDIQEELKKLPAKPGVYLMHNAQDEIIYVGKARILKNRVRQYFQSSYKRSVKIEHMVSHIAYFEYIITDSELEALVLECNLIKEHRPHYNTMLKDDKSYPYIRVTVQEDYPRILFCRNVKRDKSKYFGPYTSAGAVKETIELMHKVYKIRNCSRVLPRDIGKERPCLYHQIRQCDAPCQGYISKEQYRENVEQALRFLNGDDKKILKDLEEKMLAASAAMEFEDAAEYRDLMNSVKRIGEKQKINDTGGDDRDIIALAKAGDEAVVAIFFIRNGKLLGRDHFHMGGIGDSEKSEILMDFVKQFYMGTPFIPREILLQEEVPDTEILEKWLSDKRGGKVSFLTPKRGTKHKMMELAYKNAQNVLIKDSEKLKREEHRTIGAVHELEQLLGIRGLNRMEAFDISNTNGYENVASMVVFEKGKARRSDYRKFKIRTVAGPDDYRCMEEALTRRFSHGIRETAERSEKGLDPTLGSFTRFPDILMMDGGKGQVNVALKVLDDLGLSIPVCGMVKDDYHRTRGLYYNNEIIQFPKNSEAFRMITRLQDEAHRFAIEYHKSLRSKGQVHSVLDDIKGVGPARRKALMRYFKDIDKIRQASPDELMKAEGITARVADEIFSFFHESDVVKEEQPVIE
ncbi:excinuclease ABC subunit UvrC [Eubacterium sp. An3]|mgnify:FL=1|uniref:excinuclease ABC subunit UvrC n=1 Tax=Eubacterium sp. An3 TaxID=1965628 RepID=UPI000B36F52C|nr:excinuclease ABC subunit UvrC [Eubacterium sp. An3]OUO28911.1 excinuclease ABC subunit C [Eubacterium sp. An3]